MGVPICNQSVAYATSSRHEEEATWETRSNYFVIPVYFPTTSMGTVIVFGGRQAFWSQAW